MAKKTNDSEATEPSPHPEVLASATGQETVDEKLAKLDKELTARINAIRTQVGTVENSTDGRLDDVERHVRTLQTTAANNADTLKSFQADIDQIKALAAKLKTADSGLGSEVRQAIEAQNQKNQALAADIEVAKGLAQAAQTSAIEHIDAAEQRLNQRIADTHNDLNDAIKVVAEAPVKPHTHTVHLSGVTGGVQQGNGGK